MAEITASLVNELRKRTNVGLMECKKALIEAGGDVDEAVQVLRKKGAVKAAGKASREAKEGIIAQFIQPDAKLGTIVEVNCETDFVAKNEGFQAFCGQIASLLTENPSADLETLRTEQVAKLGENIQISRHERLAVEGNGLVAAYIHTGAKVGVLVEVGAEKPESTTTESFKQLVRDITLQIAAASPVAITRDEVDPEIVAKERDVAEDQAKGKPEQAVQKIVDGKLNKFFQGVCLLDQGFVKQNGDISIREHIANAGKELGDTITIRKFVRYQLGQA
jgi:elongation factor Ts